MFRNFHLINESIHCRNDVFQNIETWNVYYIARYILWFIMSQGYFPRHWGNFLFFQKLAALLYESTKKNLIDGEKIPHILGMDEKEANSVSLAG